MEHEYETTKEYSDASLFHILSPLPLLRFLQSHYDGINSFQIPGFCVGVANCPVEFPAGQHAHSDYEFMMPLNNNVYTKCDNEILEVEKQKMMPFNSGQYHGPGDSATIFNGFIIISCAEDFLKGIFSSVYGKPEIRFINETFSLTSDMRLLLSLFIEEGVGKQKGATFMQENLANMFLTHIVRTAKLDNILQPNNEKHHENRKIKLAVEFLRKQFNSEFSLAHVSQIAGLSPYYFIKVFKKQIGKTPYDFLLEVKIEKAKEFLLIKDMNITEICFSCGFNNPSHFASIFKRRTGLSPTEYRKKLLNVVCD